MAEGRIVGVQVDVESVLVIQRVVLPPQLYVGDLQGIADGLDGVGAGALGRAEYCYDPEGELVAGWRRREEAVRETRGSFGGGGGTGRTDRQASGHGMDRQAPGH